MILETLLAFALDFNAPHTTDYSINFIAEKDIKVEVIDPYRGKRKADGWCEPQRKRIVINISHWNKINKWQKRELLYHELGHCVLDLGHTEGPTVMNPFNPNIYHVKSDGSNWRLLVEKMKDQVNLERQR